jgi:hypothetical protein
MDFRFAAKLLISVQRNQLAPRQRHMSHGSLHQWIFGRKKHSCGSSAPLPYSPDLSPCDFFLYPRLKNHLKERHFSTLDNIQKSVTDELKGIPAEASHLCYEQWKQRLPCYVAAQGNYFEGDNSDLYKRIKFMVKRKSVSLLFGHIMCVIGRLHRENESKCFDMYMSYRPVISYDLTHRTYTVPSSWRHTMNKKQKLSSVAHSIIVSW